MKFGKKLQHQLDNTLPEWRPNFLCYKQLKKRLKQLGSTAPMAFLTAAILDGNSSIEDEFLGGPVGTEVDIASGAGEREGDMALKRGLDADSEFFEERKKRKVDLDSKENGPEDFSEGSLEPSGGAAQQQVGVARRNESPTEKDEKFLRLVRTELYKFNAFFLEKEEEFLIRLDVLEERTEKLKEKRLQQSGGGGGCDPTSCEELILIHRQIVTLHGEMVLLMDYSSLNYVGLLKILKKYDKHYGATLRQSVHGSVLRQPFFSTTNLKALVERSLACENSLQSIFPIPDGEVVEMESARVRIAADEPESEAAES